MATSSPRASASRTSGVQTAHAEDVEGPAHGGFFAFRRQIFGDIGPGEELVEEPFRRLIGAGKLLAHRYDGFWTAMDTFKDLQRLEALWEGGSRPWAVWRTLRVDDAGPAC